MISAIIDYVTSKFDYKKAQVVDLYTLRIRRTQEEIREDVLKDGLEKILDSDLVGLQD